MRGPDPSAEPLPSKDLVLEACTGRLITDHPVLCSANELAYLHIAAQRVPDARNLLHRRIELIRHIDCWLARELPPAHGGAHLHTESVGAVVDRLARYTASARMSLLSDDTVLERHYAWQRLAELAVGYSDLAYEVGAGIRRIPDLGHPRPATTGPDSR
ncbi:DUF4254 domain-containing protein [Nocardia cyriacigeorgica]|uniref:DUF4254 domain-containing protein n=1 Tax=Nocardia cyriacigeorgica TaxID=135487 RepID=A0A6P1D973_9NOCA|nr:DUF4254 domain-containing protein [Nocardia cyriacigeorgica]NEW47256.1 DUF4254 domain-containing protein [Nocardia cyriacigeorgica]NEW51808.1 DUF4254 domain-containing protein [Nocardia cyriacigeorgica]